jgi:hypothetical protein
MFTVHQCRLQGRRHRVSPAEASGGHGAAVSWLELFGGLVLEVPHDLGGVAGVVGLVDA